MDIDNPAKPFPHFFMCFFPKLFLIQNRSKIKYPLKICELFVLVSKTILMIIVAYMPISALKQFVCIKLIYMCVGVEEPKNYEDDFYTISNIFK